jgi:protein gp37
MNRTKIEWTDYTWNPVVGCKNNCWYCYAKRMNDRFKWIKNWVQPQFFPERLKEPLKIEKPSKIFVGSMCDLFGDWVPKKWIEDVLAITRACYWHTFQFLTKNPARYLEFKFTSNCRLGTTITERDELKRLKTLTQIDRMKNYLFISIEPIRGAFQDVNFDKVDEVIIGAMTGPGSTPPKKEWIDSIRHPNIFFKNNIKQYLNEINTGGKQTLSRSGKGL